ncbi:GDSL-type esterase/lipase family protein [Paenibacillus tuaregi]|uniref:GDSL-type esterase/lipase family protein n=1 Tax=Paenibacillus tuaregi TaxID=1816681 RepID=UPI000A9F5EE0|nr:GDSL-type esterase/lipase family protein [Paenibacillus tuaregi]
MANMNDAAKVNTAVIPVPKLEEDCYDWWERHEQVLREKDKINPEVVLIGDSITHFWGGDPQTEGIEGAKEAWRSVFASYRVLNLGFGWDRTQNVLWRIDHGELTGLNPTTVVILIGTNNTSETVNARANDPDEIAEGLRAICDRVHVHVPHAAIVIMAVLPREEKPDHPRRTLIAEINARYAELAKKRNYAFVDIGLKLLEADGTLTQQMASDFCHLTEQGYQLWADALRPLLPQR